DTDTDTDTDPGGPLAILGTWVDGVYAHSISETEWVVTLASAPYPSSTYHISQYSNDSGTVIAENDSTNGTNPGSWSRFDWADVDADTIWVCHTASDGSTEADAESTTAADSADPATGGCSGDAWTELTIVSR
ncbi:MAG: hypothetical protein QGG40_03635, partial [Myxococcota bacterium]|nr:hypothetical protein [Myxococcota bacterium]